MKYVSKSPYADPDTAARKIVELANSVEPIQDGRIYIEKINGPMLFDLKATPAEYRAGLKRAIENGWLVLHESGHSCGSPRQARICSRREKTIAATPWLMQGIWPHSPRPQPRLERA